jgi:hypothetical protein
MLTIADNLFQRKALGETSLIKFVIARCPEVLRPMLIKYTREDGEWYLFLREARENNWIAFGDNDNNNALQAPTENIFAINSRRFTRSKPSNTQPNQGNKWCDIHGKCYHATNDCKTLRTIKKLNLKVMKDGKVLALTEDEYAQRDQEPENKNDYAYLFSLCKYINDFLINVKIGNSPNYLALLDTGADVSVIQKTLVPLRVKIDKNSIPNLKSACGGTLPIIGSCTLDFLIDDTSYKTRFFITNNAIPHILLGKNFIVQNKNVLYKTLYQVSAPQSKFVTGNLFGLGPQQPDTTDNSTVKSPHFAT